MNVEPFEFTLSLDEDGHYKLVNQCEKKQVEAKNSNFSKMKRKKEAKRWEICREENMHISIIAIVNGNKLLSE